MATRDQASKNERTERTSAAQSAKPETADAQSERERGVTTAREGEGRMRGQQYPAVGAGLAPRDFFSDPFSVMRRLSEDVDRLFESFGFGGTGIEPRRALRGEGLRRGAAGLESAAWSPQVDIFQRGENLVVRADLPGLSKDDVTVNVEDGVLTIEGERRQEQEDSREGYFRTERSYGTFFRSIALPEGVDEGKVDANFRDGVLEVTVPVPKREERRGRRVEIR